MQIPNYQHMPQQQQAFGMHKRKSQQGIEVLCKQIRDKVDKKGKSYKNDDLIESNDEDTITEKSEINQNE